MWVEGVSTMDCGKLGGLIRRLRLEKGMTQRALADELRLCDKTVSKWERGMGCPDVSLLEPLSRILGADLARLLRGDIAPNDAEGGNMQKTKFYLCPACGSIALCSGGAELSCCGRKLPALEPRKAEAAEKLRVEKVEDEWYVTSDHPMEKDNYIAFVAFVRGDRVELVRQYPEWNLQLRLPCRGHGRLVWCAVGGEPLWQAL